MIEILSGWLLGILLGMRHALEADHLVAVSTLLADGQRSRFRGAALGAFWGLGHTVALFAVGLILALLQARMPPRVADGFELAVAFMLMALGLRTLWRAAVNAPPPAGRAPATRPLLVGVVHGLAGSGALTALVVAQLPTTGARLAYIGLFGLGSMLGMALLSGLVGVPLVALGKRPQVLRSLAVATGTISMALGIFWALPILPWPD